MKLSELIDLRNKLNEFPTSEAQHVADEKLGIIMHLIGSQSSLEGNFLSDLEQKQKAIHESFTNFDADITKLKNYLTEQIAETEKQWFQESYKLFETQMSQESNDLILNRRPSKTGENRKFATFQSESVLRARLSSYSDWRFPGMVIRPGLENFIEHMVGYDPLYILDQNHDLLKPCLNQFPKLYQNRLRAYTINDRSSDLILEKIPNNQFGICLVYNFFNYRPFEIIRRYLEEIYEKLRPGGILLMTYNDCDQSNAVELVEKFYACYTPGYLIRSLANSIGFEQLHTWGDDGPSVWLELKKPGVLHSIRGGQAIAQIKNIDELDFNVEKIYTNDDYLRLRNEAFNLGITWDRINSLNVSELVLTVRDTRTTKQEIEARENQTRLLQQQAEEEDRRRKEELRELREKALTMGLGDPNLVRYGYSVLKLKELIKQAEEKGK